MGVAPLYTQAEMQQDKTKGVRIIVTRYVGGAIAYDCQKFYRELDGWRSVSNASTLTKAVREFKEQSK